MVIVSPDGKKKYYMDGILKSNLDITKKVIHKDWDMVFLVDGQEGSGKSTLSLQCAYYCDPTLNNSRVCFTAQEFQTAILKAKPYQAVTYDEAYTGLSSRATMSLINRTLVSMLAEIRQKNLFVFIVMPTFFDLDKYVALWRSRALIHVFTGDMFERGYFSFYNYETKKIVYTLGKKLYNYKPKTMSGHRIEPNFFGRFTNFLPINEEEYRKKKREALNRRQKTQNEIIIEKQLMNRLLERAFALEGITHKTKWQLLGIPESTYWVYYRKWKEKGSI